MANEKDLRIGNEERSAALDALSTHFADGRLDVAEFDARTADAVSATYQSDLDRLLRDLPPVHSSTTSANPGGTNAAAASNSPYTPGQLELVSEYELAEIKRKGEILKKTDTVTIFVMVGLFAAAIFTSQNWLMMVAMAVTAAGLIGARAAIGMSDAEEDFFEEIDHEESQAREERLRLALERRKELGH